MTHYCLAAKIVRTARVCVSCLVFLVAEAIVAIENDFKYKYIFNLIISIVVILFFFFFSLYTHSTPTSLSYIVKNACNFKYDMSHVHII